MELWAPTYALDPEAIGHMNQEEFGFRYCGATLNRFGQWEFKHSSNEIELKNRLQLDFMHVVGEEALSHPERRRSMLFMNEDVRTPAVKLWERKHLAALRKGEIDESWSQGELASIRKELGLAKLDWMYNYTCDRLTEKKEQILLFVWHREVAIGLYEKFNKRFKPGVAALVIGGTNAESREYAFESFQRGRCRIIIGNIQAMGRGHNLQAANRVVFGEFSWTDELNKQCEKRTSRRGNESDFVRCEYIVAPGTIDEVVLDALFRKEKTVRKVIG
jgi:SNF2 family DNA or RNA helicase